MSKYTKGPCRVSVSTDSYGWENYTINGGEEHPDKERKADRLLIAAAPDMAEALSRVSRLELPLLLKLAEEDSRFEVTKEVEKVILQVAAALKKAGIS